mgnify:CR=1 FL=1
MEKEIGKKMKDVYNEQFKEHGYNPASLGCAKGRQHLRFKALSAHLERGSLLDFGCGFGDLSIYLENYKKEINYSGCDVMDNFLSTAKEQYPNKNFFKIEIGENINKEYDYIVASGVFNFLYSTNKIEHQEFVFATIANLFSSTTKVLSIDFLSPFVDFVGPDAYHQNITELTSFISSNISQRLSIDHTYMPYEYCIHIFKKDEILRPDNVFKT